MKKSKSNRLNYYEQPNPNKYYKQIDSQIRAHYPQHGGAADTDMLWEEAHAESDSDSEFEEY